MIRPSSNCFCSRAPMSSSSSVSATSTLSSSTSISTSASRSRVAGMLVGHNALERVVENHGGQRIQVVALHRLTACDRGVGRRGNRAPRDFQNASHFENGKSAANSKPKPKPKQQEYLVSGDD